MTRLIIKESVKEGQRISVKREERHYLVDVLRLGKGGGVRVVDGEGNEFSAVIEGIYADAVELGIVEKLPDHGESPLSVRLYVGLLKGRKMERVVTDGVELGVVSITPFISSRTVPKGLSDSKLLRLKKISREQSRLSMRRVVPEVFQPVSFYSAIDKAEGERLIFYEGEGEVKWRGFPSGESRGKNPPEVVSLFTGPEGGFSREEIESALSSGFRVVGLGTRILRAETAPGIASAIVQYEWGDLKGI
ncbi:MAG: 16S rRNA (uracil(1498)-N(3))-methyltransferase [Deltaproteobacteria bacterium]|uniref:Ribosomal RNA small subunit methyltransferase E n=1 Tax=Candidatus Zymogenus saltonus TaxID=2844893 RepID=A0A9D8PQT1_9DELT|nr:16S rRNA (uracil(1498)-N(3))-methyltransferase [Candidatus Zymogenus saltonus]